MKVTVPNEIFKLKKAHQFDSFVQYISGFTLASVTSRKILTTSTVLTREFYTHGCLNNKLTLTAVIYKTTISFRLLYITFPNAKLKK